MKIRFYAKDGMDIKNCSKWLSNNKYLMSGEGQIKIIEKLRNERGL